MFSWYRNQSLARQIVQIASVLLVAIFTCLTVLVTTLNERSALQQTEETLLQQTQAMKLQLDAYFDNVKERGNRSGILFRKFLAGDIVRGAGTVRTGDVDLPELRIGSQIINANHDVLEKFKALSGDEAAILWVGEGKVSRVATLLKKDGKPMDGSLIAADDPVAVALLQGKDYAGLTVRNGEYYFSSVKAVRGEGDKGFVALSVRISLQAELAQMRSMFGSMRSGKTGYAYILRPTGKSETLAEFVLHPTLQGKTVDATNNPTLRQAIEKIVAAKEGVLHYDFPDATGKSREKVVALATSPGWGWIIGTGSWLDEYLEHAHQLRSWMIGLGMLSALLAAVLIFLLVRSRLQPLAQAVEVAKAISGGRLDSDIQATSHDEIGTLMDAMKEMQQDLRAIITDIQTVVEAAASGDFSRQLELAGKRGFGLEISKSINGLNSSLLAQIGGNPADAANVARRIAAGDLSGTVDVRAGDTQSILAAMAMMRESLTVVIAGLQEMVNAAVDGDFSKKIDSSAMQGYSRTLCDLMNRLSDVTEGGLQDVIRVAQALADGDLTQKITQDYPGLFGQLKEATNATVEGLKEIVLRIQEAAATINVAAKEIAQGNIDLSGRTEEQASSLEETASSMEQLSGTVRQNTDNAFHANELASTSNDNATRSGEMVGRIVETMHDIQSSSRKIADIIGVIDGISFQTNILALNAAVEAARAGEHGRGFAVVATEVRNLAQRSAMAAKEIRGLISKSVAEVDGGVTLVRDAGETMAGTVRSFEQVSSLITGIAEASKEQSDGIEQVTRALGQMDRVTQQNAALVEEAAAAAKGLEDQARVLSDTLARFKLDHGARLSGATRIGNNLLPASQARPSSTARLTGGRAVPRLPHSQIIEHRAAR